MPHTPFYKRRHTRTQHMDTGGTNVDFYPRDNERYQEFMQLHKENNYCESGFTFNANQRKGRTNIYKRKHRTAFMS